jgi:flagellar export protein FliJ
MNAFRFPLQKVLDWRRTQLELEEVRFRQQSAAMADLDRTRAQLSAAGSTAERQVRVWNPVAGGELAALGSFRLHMRLKETQLAVPMAECRKELGRRESVMLEARRRLRLLERLRERRLAEWCEERDKELDALASEAYLAKWKRRQT